MRDWPYGSLPGLTVGEAMYYVKRRRIGLEFVIHRSGGCVVIFHGDIDGRPFEGKGSSESMIEALDIAWSNAIQDYEHGR